MGQYFEYIAINYNRYKYMYKGANAQNIWSPWLPAEGRDGESSPWYMHVLGVSWAEGSLVIASPTASTLEFNLSSDGKSMWDEIVTVEWTPLLHSHILVTATFNMYRVLYKQVYVIKF